MRNELRLGRILSTPIVRLSLLLLLSNQILAQTENERFESAFKLSASETAESSESVESNSNSEEILEQETLKFRTEFEDLTLREKDENRNEEVDIVKILYEILSKKDENEDIIPQAISGRIGEQKRGKYVRYDSGFPDTDRYAPHPDDSTPDYVLTDLRLKEIRSQFMYWYFDKGGDTNNGDYQTDIRSSTPQIHKNFNFYLPFYGFRFNYTRVSMNGYLEFSDPPEHYTYPLVFPVKNWPKENDPSFIGIFFSKCRIGKLRPTENDQRRPGVYYRLVRDLQRRTDQFGVEMRERVKWDIREGVVGSDTFDPKHAVIVTWKNMSFFGGIDHSLYTTNTFQMVLATDEVNTYAIFNYLDIQWTTHTEAGGDTVNGEGGVPAYVGFNGGNGTQSCEYKPYSQMSTIRDLTRKGWANGFPGRHIFKIDDKIMLQ